MNANLVLSRLGAGKDVTYEYERRSRKRKERGLRGFSRHGTVGESNQNQHIESQATSSVIYTVRSAMATR